MRTCERDGRDETCERASLASAMHHSTAWRAPRHFFSSTQPPGLWRAGCGRRSALLSGRNRGVAKDVVALRLEVALHVRLLASAVPEVEDQIPEELDVRVFHVLYVAQPCRLPRCTHARRGFASGFHRSKSSQEKRLVGRKGASRGADQYSWRK